MSQKIGLLLAFGFLCFSERFPGADSVRGVSISLASLEICNIVGLIYHPAQGIEIAGKPVSETV